MSVESEDLRPGLNRLFPTLEETSEAELGTHDIFSITEAKVKGFRKQQMQKHANRYGKPNLFEKQQPDTRSHNDTHQATDF